MRTVLMAVALGLGLAGGSGAQVLDLDAIFEERDLGVVERMLAAGKYDLVARIGVLAEQEGMKSVVWRRTRLEALRAMGRVQEALDESAGVVKQYPGDLRLLMLRHDLAGDLGRSDVQSDVLAEVNEVAKAKPAVERSAEDWVALGQAALVLGADATQVIKTYLAPAKRKDASYELAYLAEGWLALEKSDAARAAEVFREGLKFHGESARLRHGLAAAFFGSDRGQVAENVRRALAVNPWCAEAKLIDVELAVAGERYFEAEAMLQSVLEVDAGQPGAWALRAALLAITTADEAAVVAARAEGLKRWADNPAVDHTMGRVLSRAYRFAEGAERQRQALERDPEYLAAKVQLCHDLLRLGEEAEAWRLAEEVRAVDGYHVGAFNLGKLEREMAAYTEQRRGGFTLRLPERDWAVYGERALDLLMEARAALVPRYGAELSRNVLVEFFPSQQDFAIRTFGNLGGQGILGACFGTVMTLNSPGSLGHGRNNWESTLWHEFCHVVTLTATKNRMPRWLSEGISVYEEGKRDGSWGMRMTADYRQMMLEGKATPLSQLSQAFLNAEGGEDLMFAYYQSGQVVAFLLERYGAEVLRQVLADLAAGMRINEALEQRTMAMVDLEAAFAEHLRDQVRRFEGEVDWKEPAPDEVNATDEASVRAWAEKHPQNRWAQLRMMAAEAAAGEWEAVMKRSTAWVTGVPEDAGAGSGWAYLARAARELGAVEREIEALTQMASRDGSAMEAHLRLMELHQGRQEWGQAMVQARRATEVNPFLPGPWQVLAEASAALGEASVRRKSLETLLALPGPNLAAVRFSLAETLREREPERAKRLLLEALVEAPRFRAAHRQLLGWE